MPAQAATKDATGRTFKEAYGVLQQHAKTLRDQSEPNIDDLLTIVKESVEAYEVCKERIDAVEAALKAALNGAGVAAASTSATAQDAAMSEALRTFGTGHTSSTRPTPMATEASDDDIPF